MRKISWALSAGVSLVLLGCAGIDLDKGVPIAELSLSNVSTRTSQVHLAEGSADIAVAVRDGRCRPVNPEANIDVAIRGADVSVERSMKMGDLTWAYAEGSCDAYGYMYDAATGLSKKFDLKAGDYKVVAHVRPASPEQRVATLWIIYGGRAPTTRMFPPASGR